MQLFLEDKPIIFRLLEDTYYSQIIPRIICQSLDTTHTLKHNIADTAATTNQAQSAKTLGVSQKHHQKFTYY